MSRRAEALLPGGRRGGGRAFARDVGSTSNPNRTRFRAFVIRPLAFASLTALSGAFVYGAYVVMAGAAAVAVPACTSDDGSTGITPITGIVVGSESLTAGHGCGEAPGQVFKYAAVVTRIGDGDGGTTVIEDGGTVLGTPLLEGVYDCFADSTFTLQSPSDTTIFQVNVYAFDAVTWDTNQLAIACAAVMKTPQGATQPVVVSEPGTCAGFDAAATGGGSAGFDAVLSSVATWRTTCSAAQVLDISVIAVCNPLTAVAH